MLHFDWPLNYLCFVSDLAINVGFLTNLWKRLGPFVPREVDSSIRPFVAYFVVRRGMRSV